MKGRPKVTRIQLEDHIDEEFAIFGLVSTEADYKLSQLINKKLKIALKNIETILENQNLSVREFIQENNDKACPAILEAQLRSTEVSFNRMEDKIHDMIIYLCRAMTVSKAHNLQNLLGEVDRGVEL